MRYLFLLFLLSACGGSPSQTLVMDASTKNAKDTTCQDQVTKQSNGTVLVTKVCNGEVVSVDEYQASSYYGS